MKISLIAAIGVNRELGQGNELIWKIPTDMKRFREKTSGHPVIMGRKTFESIGRLVPNRTNIIVSRSNYVIPDSIRDPENKTVGVVVDSIEDAFEKAKDSPGSDEVFVMGGAQIYTMALPRADRLYLTKINAGAPMADAFFPEYPEFNKVIFSEKHNDDGLEYEIIDLER